MKICIINGPNINNLGKRDPGIYGKLTLDDINKKIKTEFPNDQFEFFQSNLEGEIINRIQSVQNKFDGLIINPGGYAHTSVAIKDALSELKIPKIEVHLSNLSSREEYRQKMLTASSCNGYISGFKERGYYAAVFLLKKIIEENGD
jgi:3-dehydroquinate dehydratase II